MRRVLQILALMSGVACVLRAQAQVVFDGTKGGRTIVEPQKTLPMSPYEIQAADGTTMGKNLFHSFARFTLPNTTDRAVFLAPVGMPAGGIRNILARVTSSEASTINGTIESRIGGANLFLINPNGITFGDKASVQVSGSFVATTANHLFLGADGRFDATDYASTHLSVAEPSAFGFLAPDPARRVAGKISVLGTLNADGAKSVSLIGGDVILDNAVIDVPDGALHVIGARGPGNVQMDSNTPRPQPIPDPGVAGGNVTATNSYLGANFQTRQVVIRGGKLVLVGSGVGANPTESGDGIAVHATGDLQVDGGFIYATTNGDFTGHSVVDISAQTASLSGAVFVAASTTSLGKRGDVHLSIAGSLELSGGASIVSAGSVDTAGGDLRIDTGSLTVKSSASIYTQPPDSGISPGGDIFVNAAGRLEILSGGSIEVKQSPSRASNIFISARDVFISGADAPPPRETGVLARLFADSGNPGGLVRLDVSGTLEIRNGGTIDAQTLGVDGARIEVAAGKVLIDGAGTVNEKGINAKNQTVAGGSGGVIQLEVADSVQLLNGGFIGSNTTGVGAGGNIDITAGSLVVEGKGLMHDSLVNQGITSRNQSSGTSGPGGDIRLAIRDAVELRNGAEIQATTTGSGRGGNIAIVGGSISLGDNSLIAAEAGLEATGAGGDVALTTSGVLRIESGGLISVSTRGAGAGGSIEIAADALAMSGAGSSILATTDGSGGGGSIFISGRTGSLSGGSLIAAETTAALAAGAGGDLHVVFDDTLTITGGGRISVATSGAGVGGSVQVRADQLFVSGSGSAVSAQSLGIPNGGDGGNIVLKVGELSLEDHGGILSSSSGSGRAGTITIDAERGVTLTGGSSIAATATESSGGNIAINGGEKIELENGRISAEAKTKGGNIRLVSSDILHLFESQIIAAANTDGGNIFIDPEFVLLDRARISANAVVGRGGNIQIFSKYFIASPDSLITASSEKGISGEVRINAVNVDLTGNLVELPSSVIRAESLLRELCTVKLRDFSSFIVEGRGGMAPVPGEWLSSLEPELPRKEAPADR